MMHQIATLFGIGYLRPAPGTWGSLAALPLALVLVWVGGPWLLVAATVAVGVLGFLAVRAEISVADPDPGHVVIDEVAGQWVALLPVAFGAVQAGVPVTALWPGWVAAFFLFRLFDIAKPGPIGWADRQQGARGVMLDDLIAGLFAAVGVIILAALSHALMML
jgi:phosphatidylglycerophosphatase A